MVKILTVLALLASASGEHSFYSDIRMPIIQDVNVVRATARTLMVEGICLSSSHPCSDVQWLIQSKDPQLEPRAGSPERHRNGNAIFKGLSPGARYYVSGRTGTKVVNVTVDTCSKTLLPVRDLRAVSTGAGWLELRWRRPADSCPSHMLYHLRYRPLPGNFTTQRLLGIVDSSKGRIEGPVHPCPPWPKEFCALLTDAVLPGYSHEIEVIASRFEGLSDEISPPKNITVLAGQIHVKDGVVVPWGRRPGRAGDKGLSECAQWAGVAIGAGVATLVCALAMALVTLRQKKAKYAARMALREAQAKADANADNVNDSSNNAIDGYNNANDSYNNGNDSSNNANDGYNNANDSSNTANDGSNNANDGYNNGNDSSNNANDGYNNANDSSNNENNGSNNANGGTYNANENTSYANDGTNNASKSCNNVKEGPINVAENSNNAKEDPKNDNDNPKNTNEGPNNTKEDSSSSNEGDLKDSNEDSNIDKRCVRSGN